MSSSRDPPLNFLSSLTRGLLTGKFKKGDRSAPKGSRMELASQGGKPGFQNMPNINNYLEDDKFWTLMDAMTKIADTHGEGWGRLERGGVG